MKHPPGGIYISDSTYFDATEVANIHFLEFEYYIKSDSSLTYWKSILPNDTVNKNFRDPSKRYLPITGITKWQAEQYCKWRSDVVNEKFENELGYKVLYRLPKEAEWEQVAQKLDTTKYLKGRKGNIYRKSKKSDVYHPGVKQVYSPNNTVPSKTNKKFFNLIGNVAEMISDKDVVKGGSWKHTLSQSYPSESIPYDPAQPYDWVGFRCIAIVISR